MTFSLICLLLMSLTTENAEAKNKRKKNSAVSSHISKNKKKKHRTTNKSKRFKKSKRSGTGPDLRALTTEQPNSEYIQKPDNGVNAIEMKTELQ